MRAKVSIPAQRPSLTTPIYETSTFVFDSVADVEKYQEGKLNGYLYSRYENPTVVVGRAEARGG